MREETSKTNKYKNIFSLNSGNELRVNSRLMRKYFICIHLAKSRNLIIASIGGNVYQQNVLCVCR